MKKFILWALVAIAFGACKKDDKKEVIELKHDTRYTFEVSVKGFWTAETHPQDFPQEAKFGKIIGISHNHKNTLFNKGKKAESWLKSYFEDANTETFSTYFQEYKERDKVDAIFTQEGFPATGATTFELTTKGSNHLVSLLMQLSPSPDWFVAANNIDLDVFGRGSYGSVSYVVSVFDAGIYSGKTYKEKGSATNDAITYKIDAPLAYPKGGINNLAVITIRYKSSEKIKKD